MITIFLILGAVVVAGAVGFFIWKRRHAVPEVLTALPPSSAGYPRIFEAWIGIDGAVTDENIARHDLYIQTPESYGVWWRGQRGQFCAPSLAGQFEPDSVADGLAKRADLRALNPDIKLLVQIGYTEGADGFTDFPPDHPWWLRVNGERVPGWIGGNPRPYLFNLGLPEVLRHCADCCAMALSTGVWDGIMLDVFVDDDAHLDLVKKVRAAIGNALLQVNLNYNIAPQIAPYLNGVFMECGPIASAAQWQQVQAALDYYERHVRPPQINCLEIAGARTSLNRMRAATCLALTRSNGYVLYADPGPNYATTHDHGWYRPLSAPSAPVRVFAHEIHRFWGKSLGSPVGTTLVAGSIGSRREFQHGTAVFNPPGGAVIYLTFPEPRLSVAHGEVGTAHFINAYDGDIFLK